MANFSPELFFDLAKYADKNTQYLAKHETLLDGEFDETDFQKIDDFKDAIFMVIMLRAARYMVLTGQKTHAFGHFGVVLTSRDVHPTESIDEQKNILNSVINGNGLFEKFGPIPRKTIRSLLDDDFSRMILEEFDETVLALACKNPQ